jgi:hypothetical protein
MARPAAGTGSAPAARNSRRNQSLVVSPGRRREYRNRHPRDVPVGPLLRSRDTPSAQLVRQLAASTPHRTTVQHWETATTVCNNKGHDLLLPGSPTAFGIQKHSKSESLRKLRQQRECRNRIGTRRIWDTDYRWYRSSRPHLLTAGTHAGVATVTCTGGAEKPDGTPPNAPLSSELRHCTAYPGRNPRSHLGSTLGSGKSCPDPGRLSTFGVSGLYPCRRLTYRGACNVPWWHATHRTSNPFTQRLRPGVTPLTRGLPSWVCPTRCKIP